MNSRETLLIRRDEDFLNRAIAEAEVRKLHDVFDSKEVKMQRVLDSLEESIKSDKLVTQSQEVGTVVFESPKLCVVAMNWKFQ